MVLLRSVGQGFSDSVGLFCFGTLPASPMCPQKGGCSGAWCVLLGRAGSVWVHSPCTECCPPLGASGVLGEHKWPGVWGMSEWIMFGQQKIKIWVVSFSSMPSEIANLFFCGDYFRIAPLLQGSPNYLSIFFPNPSTGWLVQVFSIEEIMRM